MQIHHKGKFCVRREAVGFLADTTLYRLRDTGIGDPWIYSRKTRRRRVTFFGMRAGRPRSYCARIDLRPRRLDFRIEKGSAASKTSAFPSETWERGRLAGQLGDEGGAFLALSWTPRRGITTWIRIWLSNSIPESRAADRHGVNTPWLVASRGLGFHHEDQTCERSPDVGGIH